MAGSKNCSNAGPKSLLDSPRRCSNGSGDLRGLAWPGWQEPQDMEGAPSPDSMRTDKSELAQCSVTNVIETTKTRSI